MMRRLFAIIGAILFLSSGALADCSTPSGYTRWGSGNWRISENLPGAPIWERLPSSSPSDISQTVRDLGRFSTGIAVHVQSNTDTLRLCWMSAAGTGQFPNWSQTSASGLDVYFRSAETDNEWRWLAVGEATTTSDNVVSIPLGTSAHREFMIYLPQYRRLTTLRVETPSGYSLAAGPTPAADPLVVLGSSIVQGSGTSRAGIAYPQALGRHFGVDTINLGFAGSCQMFVGMATLLATIDASAFVIDCFPNMSVAQVNAQMHNFIHALAAAKPNTPIYIVQDRLNQGGGPHPSFVADHTAKQSAALAILATLQGAHQNLTWIDADDLLGDDFEGSVDGSHPSDLGHYRYFTVLKDLLAL